MLEVGVITRVRARARARAREKVDPRCPRAGPVEEDGGVRRPAAMSRGEDHAYEEEGGVRADNQRRRHAVVVRIQLGRGDEAAREGGRIDDVEGQPDAEGGRSLGFQRWWRFLGGATCAMGSRRTH